MCVDHGYAMCCLSTGCCWLWVVLDGQHSGQADGMSAGLFAMLLWDIAGYAGWQDCVLFCDMLNR
jgi:hypothetical protein